MDPMLFSGLSKICRQAGDARANADAARAVEGGLYPGRPDGFRFIRANEFGYRCTRRYLASVVDQGCRRTVWAGNRNGDRRLYDLFDSAEDRRTAALGVLPTDVSTGYEHARPKRTIKVLQDRLSWDGRSRLHPFARTARRIQKHHCDALAHVDFGLTNGLLEGIHDRVRIFARRAFGFHSAETLIAIVYRCCGGISLHPPHPIRT
jgi:hypothetical protein